MRIRRDIVLASLALLLGVAAAGPAHASRRIFLWFSDGGIPPASIDAICPGRQPSAFQCALGPSVDDCRRPIQELLDRWYVAADVTFTYVAPADGAFDTVIVTSEGSWCGADANTVSRSPLPGCSVVERGSIAIYKCADSKACATLIAKEQAHLLGLQHTVSLNDVMDARGGTTHDGFEDRENLVSSSLCGISQNSHQLLRERAGAWPGGAKPAPALPAPPEAKDAGGPDADASDTFVDGASDGPVESALDAGGSADVVAPASDASNGGDAAPAESSGGCSCRAAGGVPAHGLALVAMMAALALARRRQLPARAARGARSRPASRRPRR